MATDPQHEETTEETTDETAPPVPWDSAQLLQWVLCGPDGEAAAASFGW